MKNNTMAISLEKSSSPPPRKSRPRVTKVELNDRLRQLEERVQELEKTGDATVSRLAIINEVFSMFADFPIGRRIINRAINRSKLRYLKSIVVPRRQKKLMEIQMMKMPEPIKAKFTDEALKGLIQIQRAIYHREGYEKKAGESVSKMVNRLQNMIFNFGRKRLEDSKSKPEKGGRSKHARAK